jgi:mono/diheme cytochrome c family protein
VPAPRRALLAAVPALVAVVASGCGSGSAQVSGRTVFADRCQVCHSLSARATSRQQGGSLLDLHASRPQLRQFVAEMPTRRRLTETEIAAVTDYVLAVERRQRH